MIGRALQATGGHSHDVQVETDDVWQCGVGGMVGKKGVQDRDVAMSQQPLSSKGMKNSRCDGAKSCLFFSHAGHEGAGYAGESVVRAE